MKIVGSALAFVALAFLAAPSAYSQTGKTPATPDGKSAGQLPSTDKPANINQGTKNAGDMATKKGQPCPPGLDKKKVC
jgi:hypothetical protein